MTEILVELDRDAGHLGAQLVAALRDGVRGGRIAAGTELPPTRRLAAELRVSRGVVVEAYEQLVAEGYLLSRTGAGTRVAAVRPGALSTDPATPRTPSDSATPVAHDLTPGTPDLGAFPRAAWTAALRRVLSTLPNSGLGYGDPAGVSAFRTEIASYLARVRAADADPARLVALNGVAHGLAIGLRALHERGHRVLAVEDPSADRQRHLLRGAGFELVGIPVDDAGLVVAELAASRATVALVTPAHQYPTGAVLLPQRRAELVAWARRTDAMILEDDYDAEFRYDRDPVGCLQGLAPDRVLYLGTTSKSLAPALRLGWALAPEWLARRLAQIRGSSDLGGSVLDHLTMAELIASGGYDKHLRAVRRRYRDRRDALVAALARELPRWRVRGVAAGLHVLVDLPAGTDEAALVEACLAEGVRVQGLGAMRFAPGGPGLVLGYAGIRPARLAEAAACLRRAVAGVG
jgi:GntR family transcriptional regulator/MocR family aminotransferase